VRQYFIPDFSNWKNHDAFEQAFDRRRRDLKAEETGAGFEWLSAARRWTCLGRAFWKDAPP
jgi:hypothetical protein